MSDDTIISPGQGRLLRKLAHVCWPPNGFRAPDQIRDAIRRHRVSGYQIAKSTGISASQIRLWLLGKSELGAENLARVADGMGLPLKAVPAELRDVFEVVDSILRQIVDGAATAAREDAEGWLGRESKDRQVYGKLLSTQVVQSMANQIHAELHAMMLPLRGEKPFPDSWSDPAEESAPERPAGDAGEDGPDTEQPPSATAAGEADARASSE